MKTLIAPKKIDYPVFEQYLTQAHYSNQFTNGGYAVGLLEERARDMLKIDDSKAVIACCSGTAALHAMLFAIIRQDEQNHRVVTQDFTFASASQGPASGPIIVDFDNQLNFNFNDDYSHSYGKILIVTNVFGHLQNLEPLLDYAEKTGKMVVFDNAATPYSFWNGHNSCNFGIGSMVSLHHTKQIGFGEGGLAIIDKEYEEMVRTTINFGIINKQFNERGSNFKMSELSAAGILQYWDSFNIDKLKELLLDSYYEELYKANLTGDGEPYFNNADKDEFLPGSLPFIFENPTDVSSFEKEDVKKYYHPLRGLRVSKHVYDRIIHFPLCKK